MIDLKERERILRNRALGTSIRWASVLKEGYKVPTRQEISEFLGWSVDDVEVDVPVQGTSTHFASRIRETVERLGLLRDKPWDRFSYNPPKTPRIIFCTTSSNPMKDWDGSKWDLLESQLVGRGLSVERQTQGSLRELEDQFLQATLIVGVDSGPLHLADYLGVTTLGLYGYTSPRIHGTLKPTSLMINRHRGVEGIDVDTVEYLTLGLLNGSTFKERVLNV